MEELQKKSKLRSIFITLLCIFVITLASVILIHIHVEDCTTQRIYSQEELAKKKAEEYQVILILGSGVIGSSPTPILKERLDTGISLYNAGIAPKLLMSGDNGSIHYDEVTVMRKYALEQGVPSEDIFMDYAGFSTYESMYRAEYIFGISKMVIVTQKYHLYRSIYIADSMGIDVVGVDSTKRILGGEGTRTLREILAQSKDYFSTKLKPLPKFLGEKISLEQSADEVYK